MILLFLEVVGCLALGHALVGSLFWGLLQVPESTVWMLGLSAAIVLLMVALAGFTQLMALLSWADVKPLTARLRRSLTRSPSVLIGAAIMGLLWWPTGQLAEWLAAHRGEIDGWLMLHMGWTRTAWLHSGAVWAIWLVRYGLGLSASLALVAAVAGRGYRELRSVRWVRAALAPRQVLSIICSLLVHHAGLPGNCGTGGRAAFPHPGSNPPSWRRSCP